MPHAILHLPRHQFDRFDPATPGFYGRLWRLLEARGWTVEPRRRARAEMPPEAGERAVHVIHQGVVRQAGVLNAGLSYLPGYWYLDPQGVFGESGIAEARFDPDSVAKTWAEGFAARLRVDLLAKGKTKHAQPARRTFEPGGIAVFLQGRSIPVERAAHMSETRMLGAILDGADDVPVWVKPHPRNADPEMRAELERLCKLHPNLSVVDAHVHDLLKAARVTCSLSSSVSFEGLVMGVPAVLFGRTDFHHCAVTLERPRGFAEAMARAEATDWPYARFLAWFLRKQCLSPAHGDWEARVMARMEAAWAEISGAAL